MALGALPQCACPAAPRELACTTWEKGHTSINDDRSGNVGLASLCGFVAVAALLAEAWSRRWAVVAALEAAVAFAAGVWVAGSYWLGFTQGDWLREGRGMLGRNVEVHFPLMLPLFTLAAGAGLVCALALVAHGRRRARNGCSHPQGPQATDLAKYVTRSSRAGSRRR
jgi:hypothetical protein